jgi:LDH2 family malate/lactate/ureidoglycolate dehydrogenase
MGEKRHNPAAMTVKHSAQALRRFAGELLVKSGLDSAKADVVADTLVEGDLLGHTTHGLALLPGYLADLEKGGMTKSGEPRVIADFPAAVTWDGNKLPGPWLVRRALDLAVDRAQLNGTCTVVIRCSHHIACLAAYLKRATDRGLMMILSCSDPAAKGVAPHGGRRELMTPNLIAAGWPTDGDPVMLDVSMSVTSNALTRRTANEGRKFPGQWLVDGAGNLTNDPAAAFANPPGAILPLGGADHGHKGYALGLMVEALTSGLGGHGRADAPTGWTASVFLQVLDPELFGSREDFVRQTSHLAVACRATPPRAGFDRVRLPGEAGLQRRAAQLVDGVELHPGILPALKPWAEKFRVALPIGPG